MENTKYLALTEHLKNILKTAKRLGLNVQPGGGYTMGYDINNLPPYPVGLFGALSIVEGPGGRCKLGLTFDETESLEAGFNGCSADAKSRTKKRRKNFKPDIELMKIGTELAINYANKPMRSTRYGTAPGVFGDWDNPYGMGTPKAMPYPYPGAGGNIVIGGGPPNPPKKKLEKKKMVDGMAKLAGAPVKHAQPAPVVGGEWPAVAPNNPTWLEELALDQAEAKKQFIQEYQTNKELLDELVKKNDDMIFKIGMEDLQPEKYWQQVAPDFDEPIVWKDAVEVIPADPNPGFEIAAEFEMNNDGDFAEAKASG